MSRTRYPAVCAVCKCNFLATRKTTKCCSKICVSRSKPGYLRNSQLIETAEFYLSLNFTPAQVFDDHIRDYHNIDSFVRMLERRDLSKLAQRFRRLAPRDGWPSAA